MGFIQKTFDLKKCARALQRHPGEPERMRDPNALSPNDLNPCFYETYIYILRRHAIRISDLDFSMIGEGDIDDLETVLHYSPANRLFEISDVFRRFEPSAADKRVFI